MRVRHLQLALKALATIENDFSIVAKLIIKLKTLTTLCNMSLIHMEIINLNSYKILTKEDAINQTWDIIIIGSGIGGSVSALELSQFNLKILVIEKGPNSINSEQPQLWRKSIFDIVNNRSSTPFLGECLGGSSRLYGMAMEELHPDDFEDHGGKWPSSLNDWKPWYGKAEKIFNIHPANQMSEFDPFLQFLHSKNVETRPLRLSSLQKQDCLYCQSTICLKNCKVDALTGPLLKAVSTSHVFIVTDIEVISLKQNNGVISSVLCRQGQANFELKANQFILAAGALITPLILKRSKNILIGSSFNNLNAIGCYLMRHYIDLYFLKLPGWKSFSIDKKIQLQSIKNWASDSYYNKNGIKLGTMQAFGKFPEFEYIWSELKDNELRSIHRLPYIKKVIQYFIKSIFQYPIVSTIIEDEAMPSNKVFEDENGNIKINYQVCSADQIKIAQMQKHMKHLLGPFLKHHESQAYNNFRLAHVCGTARMGHDLNSSVTDEYGKVHQSENLWIADSSVFPSSTGKNPSLTIAAQAIKMVHKIHR